MEKYPPQGPMPVVDTPGDEPCSQIWSVYNSEAEKYDKALVDGWRNNMSGILIFAGLFSAILTAFIVESYKLLNPTVDLPTQVLLRMSQQLADSSTAPFSMSTDYNLNMPLLSQSTPGLARLCNILWFISLGLSLASALTATLVDQWAREFLQRTEMLPSPVKRARIFAYLYYGMQRFRMHAIVGVIPLLLHMSVLFFFGGLVAFLKPVDKAVTAVAATLLAVIIIIYAAMSLLPLLEFDCPYKTPLSTILWSGRRYFARVVQRRQLKHATAIDSPHLHSMVDAMIEKATVRDPEGHREKRDERALAWTMKSLADDDELEPFVEGIPNAIWGPDGRRFKYDNLILGLFRDSQILLGSRIEHLMLSCETGLLEPTARTRRQLSCLKAIWCLGMIAVKNATPQQPLHFLQGLRFLPTLGSPVTDPYLPSIVALVDWNKLCTLHGYVKRLDDLLKKSQADMAVGKLADMDQCQIFLQDFLIAYRSYTWRHVIPIAGQGPMSLEELHKFQEVRTLNDMNDWILQVQRIVERVPACWNKVQYRILHSFLRESADLPHPPYEFELTCKTIQPSDQEPFDGDMVGNVLATFSDNVAMAVKSKDVAPTHRDTILGILLPWFDKNRNLDLAIEKRVTDSVIEYINNREQTEAIARVLRDCDITRVWKRVTDRLETCRPEGRGEVSKAMWQLLMIFPGPSTPNTRLLARPKFNGATLSVRPTEQYSPSVIALLKTSILNSYAASWQEILSNLQKLHDLITVNEQATKSNAFMTAVYSVETDWALMTAVLALFLPLPFAPTLTQQPRRPLPPMPIFPQHTIETWPAYREWRIRALAALTEAMELAQRLERRIDEGRFAITVEFLATCAADGSLPYGALDTLQENLLPVLFVLQATHPAHQRGLADALDGLVAAPSVTAEQARLAQALISSSLFHDPELPWLSDQTAVQKIRKALKNPQDLFMDADSVLLTKKVEDIVTWLDQKEVSLQSAPPTGPNSPVTPLPPRIPPPPSPPSHRRDGSRSRRLPDPPRSPQQVESSVDPRSLARIATTYY